MATIQENRKNGKLVSYKFTACVAEMQTVSRFAITAHGRRHVNTLQRRPENARRWKQPNGNKPSVSTA